MIINLFFVLESIQCLVSMDVPATAFATRAITVTATSVGPVMTAPPTAWAAASTRDPPAKSPTTTHSSSVYSFCSWVSELGLLARNDLICIMQYYECNSGFA